MSEYQEFTGKSVEEAIKTACDAFGVGLADLDFEILTPGSRGVLGMGAEPARIVAAPRSALGGAAPKREAAEATPAARRRRPARTGPYDRDRARDRGPDRGPRRDDRGGYRGPRRDDRPDRGPRRDDRAPPRDRRPAPRRPRRLPRRDPDRGPRRDDRPGRDAARPARGGSELSAAEVAQ